MFSDLSMVESLFSLLLPGGQATKHGVPGGDGDRGYLTDIPVGPSHPQSSEALVRKGHLTGLKPVVLVTFQSPVNFNRWKLEQLQIQMEAAPFRSKGGPEGCLEGSGRSVRALLGG